MLFVSQSEKFADLRPCCRVIPAQNVANAEVVAAAGSNKKDDGSPIQKASSGSTCRIGNRALIPSSALPLGKKGVSRYPFLSSL
jgi:hypothetical protein